MSGSHLIGGLGFDRWFCDVGLAKVPRGDFDGGGKKKKKKIVNEHFFYFFLFIFFGSRSPNKINKK